jgi:hypothetical protein
MPAKQFLVIVVEPVVLRRNDKDGQEAQNEKKIHKEAASYESRAYCK